MDPNIYARAGAVLLLAVVAFAAVVGITRREGDDPGALQPLSRSHSDPFAAELERCRKLGVAAANDSACEAVWADMRKQFFSSEDPEGVVPAIEVPGDGRTDGPGPMSPRPSGSKPSKR